MEEYQLQSGEDACVACGMASGLERGQKNGFRILSCQNCGTLYTSHLNDAQSLHDYDAYYGAENLAVPDFINTRLDEIVAGFSSYRQTGRFLDVGFGAGSLLEAATRAGWNATGVEVSQTAAEHVRRLGFDVFCGELAEANYPAGYFDVVTASEVLEHVPDPRALVQEIARVLRPGGLFWATTPHGRGASSRVLGVKWSVISPPEHLQLFSLSSIKTLLAAAGFRRVSVLTHGVNPSEILSIWRGTRAGELHAESCDRV